MVAESLHAPRARRRFERLIDPADEAKAATVAKWNAREERPPELLFLPVLFAIMLAPLPLWVFIRHGEWDGSLPYAMRHATLPILLTLLIGIRLFMPRFWATSDWLMRGFAIVWPTMMFVFLAQVHVAVINRWLGEPEPVVVSGTVLGRLDHEGKYGVRLQTSDGVMKLVVPRREWERLVVGGQFSWHYMRGSLGLLYRVD